MRGWKRWRRAGLAVGLAGGLALLAVTAQAQQSGDAGIEAAGLIWRAPVEAGLTFEDVDAALNSVAARLNLRNVGQLPLGEQVAAMRGEPWRQLQIYMFCNPLTAAAMIEFDPSFSVWLPCRISLVEDGEGALWLYTINMDALMVGATDMPAALAEEAASVREAIRTLLEEASTGAF